jgi:hypothetical protein
MERLSDLARRTTPLSRQRLALACACLSLGTFAAAQAGTLTTVTGRVLDLSVDAQGRLLYCTKESEVGRITTAGVTTVLATSASGPFLNELRGVCETPSLDVAVIDSSGDVFRLPQGATPAVLVYDDLYMIQDPTDLAVDTAGVYAIASATPSSGQRAINWISSDGVRWAYLLVQHQPVALAADPLTLDLLFAEETGTGAIRLVDTTDKTYPTSAIDATTASDLAAVKHDGDLAVDAGGNVYWVAGGTLWRHDRALGSTASVASGFQQLRGCAIAVSSGQVASSTGWSVYLAEGNGPTSIREVGSAGAPASVQIAALGYVPGRGGQRVTFSGIRVYELAPDSGGDLLVGGDVYGADFSLRRVDLDTLALTTLADDQDGLTGRIEGIAHAPDGSIHVVTSAGDVQRVVESPLAVSTLYADVSDQITRAKDVLLERDGDHLIADRESYGGGEVRRIAASGTGTHLVATQESRGLTADPLNGDALVSEWNGTGFNGSVGRLDLVSLGFADLAGFTGQNYTNADTYGDGDLVMDCKGQVYTCSEDDWSVVRYVPSKQGRIRVGAGYLNHPSGLAIARSTSSSGSTTGWSLFVSEYDYLWEIASTAAPMPPLVDPDAPGVGSLVGYLSSSVGTPRALVADPAGDGFFVCTSSGTLERMALSTGTVTTVAGAAQGLSGDLTAIDVAANGHLIVAERTGKVYDVNPGGGYVATLSFSDPTNALGDVRGLALDGLGRTLLVERRAGSEAGVLYRLTGSTLDALCTTARGVRAAIDPLTADVFVTEQGSSAEGAGEILRVDELASLAAHGHLRFETYTTFEIGELDGDLVFDSGGDFHVASGNDGRVWRVDRAAGTRSVVAGNYARPTGLALAEGRAGKAGAQGTSLFVLDGWVVWEVGVDGLPAGAPPASDPGLADGADLAITGALALGQATPIRATNSAWAGRLYVMLPTLSGKVPGLPCAVFGDPSDPRVIPSNYDELWDLAVDPSVMPGFFGILDGSGASASNAAFQVPNDPSLLTLNAFVDVAWIVWYGPAQNHVANVGGTAQLWCGN